MAQTRAAARQSSGRFPTEAGQAFRVLVGTLGVDVREPRGKAVNMIFERQGLPNRIEITSRRRKRD